MSMRGFSLLEIILAGVLGLSVMTLGLLLFRRVGTASLSGSSQLELQLSTREGLRRLGPILRMATAPNSQANAIYSPALSQTAANVVFSSPDDQLASNPPPFDPRNPSYILLQVRYDSVSRRVLLEDFYNPTRHRVICRNVSDFRVTRTHRQGINLYLRREAQIKDARGFPKNISFYLQDAIQMPE
jgi:hypothetical protein